MKRKRNKLSITSESPCKSIPFLAIGQQQAPNPRNAAVPLLCTCSIHQSPAIFAAQNPTLSPCSAAAFGHTNEVPESARIQPVNRLHNRKYQHRHYQVVRLRPDRVRRRLVRVVERANDNVQQLFHKRHQHTRRIARECCRR
ncbi:hypothetical protein AYI69_g7433 [Smittium culicis]|uniref:Uncharacterized protein n=1 Tax=Smittium culicis TaxID=133412 RepID=A0A1R1XN59_9FUNG|nr:hypothetical protein AYI69_g7978 [Smittium culicis]OMJ17446.1 hypothetical protein AYI69_g7433 [Smittium culicis]